MRTLLSVPPALHSGSSRLLEDVFGACFATHDPRGAKLGSGGGTAHLLREAWLAGGEDSSFAEWLVSEKRVLLHSGGQSRRLPAYAPSGKALVPVPVFRWSTGQRINQSLGELQLPLLQKFLEAAGDRTHTLVASGDALVWNEAPLPPVPDADVVCVGLWDTPETAAGHGVFFVPRNDPERLDFMLQKPKPEKVAELSRTHLFLLDVGIWLLSDRAVGVLLRKSGWNPELDAATPFSEYDLYGSFGLGLGNQPTVSDPDLTSLSSAVVPLADAQFHHFGTSRDLIASSLALQNRVNDQRRIRSPLIKPHPSIFIQNAEVRCRLGPENQEVWIENSCIPDGWILRNRHVFTGVPDNDWKLAPAPGDCLDFVPLDGNRSVVRPYGFEDAFRGDVSDPSTRWMGRPASDWFCRRGLEPPTGADLQKVPLFPVAEDGKWDGSFVEWLLASDPTDNDDFRERYRNAERLSAEDLSERCDIDRLAEGQRRRLVQSLPVLARNAARSVFHQIDLHHAAGIAASAEVRFDHNLSEEDSSLHTRIRDRMFRATLAGMRGGDGSADEASAFQELREAIVAPYRRAAPLPRNSILSDQVVWARSPIRLDLAGGWTDTPPHCFLNGGTVVNLAAELNGQPPVQVFARTSEIKGIRIRSIDLGSEVFLSEYEDIGAYAEIGSGFAIARAALALCGFHPDFQKGTGYPSLQQQLKDFGGGLEISLLCAVPKGSGLGTSSVLSAAVLACLSEVAGFGWDAIEIGNRVLALEQMLTSGGGWQDQFGGTIRGLKLLETSPGLDQTPEIRWLPDHLFTDPAHSACQILYYTGLTRVAHDLLGEIVRGMFLNRRDHLGCLRDLSEHTLAMSDSLQRGDFPRLGRLVERTWQLNQRLDPGTNPPAVRRIIESVGDLLWGKKLLGAGGGGYLLLFAKDERAAARVKNHLLSNPPNSRARFVDFSLSDAGLRVTRS